PADRWLAWGLAETGVRVRAEEQAAWAAKAAHAGFPGPATPRRDLTPDQLAAWRHRALGPEIHEAVYRGLLERAELPWPRAARALYRRHMAADGWERYPDAVHVLKRLTTAGVVCGVVSNIGWDIRVPLGSAGLLPYLGTVVCSCEEGVRKPDPKLFAIACGRLGVDPAATLMVGDSPRADSGGEPLGIRTVLVSPQPPDRRPAGLLPVLAAAQLC
ncbi:HAD family hydrolase, partial [Streptomyces rhizosphaericus]